MAGLLALSVALALTTLALTPSSHTSSDPVLALFKRLEWPQHLALLALDLTTLALLIRSCAGSIQAS